MSVATALARAWLRSISTISRARARMATAMAVAAPTAPTPMIPTFMEPSSASDSSGKLTMATGVLQCCTIA